MAPTGDQAEADLFESNARHLMTLWGPSGEINDYGSRSLAGLVGSYYHKRWELQLSTVQMIVASKMSPDKMPAVLDACAKAMLRIMAG